MRKSVLKLLYPNQTAGGQGSEQGAGDAAFGHLPRTEAAQELKLSPLFSFPAGKKKATLFDSQAPICPICQVLLRPGELQEHMEQELEKLTQLNIR